MKAFLITLVIAVLELAGLVIACYIANKYRKQRNDARDENEALQRRLNTVVQLQNEKQERDNERKQKKEDRNTGDIDNDVNTGVNQLSELSRKRKSRNPKD